MWDFWIVTGDYAWLVVLIVALIGLFLAGFFGWRRMRLDYDEEGIFGMIIWLVVCGGVFGSVGYRLRYGTWGWWEGSGLVASWITLVWWCGKKKWNTYEWLDILVGYALSWGAVVCLIVGTDQLVEAGMLAVGAIGSGMVGKYYRKWKWYRSGKPGLVGLIGLAWWGLTLTVAAFAQPKGAYYGGLTVDQWLGTWLLTTGVVVLYLRSGQKLFEDVTQKWLNQKTKNTKQSNIH